MSYWHISFAKMKSGLQQETLTNNNNNNNNDDVDDDDDDDDDHNNKNMMAESRPFLSKHKFPLFPSILVNLHSNIRVNKYRHRWTLMVPPAFKNRKSLAGRSIITQKLCS